MPRVVCLAYTSGVFAGVQFREERVGNEYHGVADVTDKKALAWFRARPDAFRVEKDAPKPAGGKDAAPPADPPPPAGGEDDPPADAGDGTESKE